MKLHSIAFTLLIIGGLNWLLFVFGYDVAMWVSAEWWMSLVKLVYILVGLSALYEIFTHKNRCKECMTKTSSGGSM